MNPVSLEPGFEWSPIVRLYRTDLFLGQPGASVRGNPVVEGRSGNPHQHQKKMPTDPVRRSIVFVDDRHYTEAENTLGGRTGFWINYFFSAGMKTLRFQQIANHLRLEGTVPVHPDRPCAER